MRVAKLGLVWRYTIFNTEVMTLATVFFGQMFARSTAQAAVMLFSGKVEVARAHQKGFRRGRARADLQDQSSGTRSYSYIYIYICFFDFPLLVPKQI